MQATQSEVIAGELQLYVSSYIIIEYSELESLTGIFFIHRPVLKDLFCDPKLQYYTYCGSLRETLYISYCHNRLRF